MHDLAVIGFGGVGQALVELLAERGEFLAGSVGFAARVVAVSDPIKGSVYRPGGLDLDTLLAVVRETGRLDSYPHDPQVLYGWDSLTTIRESCADAVVEVTPTLPGGQPAIDHCRAAFASRKHVVTSNKGPAAFAYDALCREAESARVGFGIEGTVMSGTPTLQLGRTALAGNHIRQIRGILNGTTNYILSRMEQGLAYEDALAEAQRLGFAEADPTADVDGHDAQLKLVILANHVLRRPIPLEGVRRQGIRGLTGKEVQDAVRSGRRWKLLASLRQDGTEVAAAVEPTLLPLEDPLASVQGAVNAITFHCDLLGPVTLFGAGAGRLETAYALLADLIRLPARASSRRERQ